MGAIFKKRINQSFFKSWTPEMSYVLGYITADGCIATSKNRKHPFTLNITSVDKMHLNKLKKALDSEHKISRKTGSTKNIAFQIQIRNPVLTSDLINLGIRPRKTYNLNSINVPNKYFADFARGFFDGDGSVYVYKVNKVPQIKAGFTSVSLSFINEFNKSLCGRLRIPLKSIHRNTPKTGGMTKYDISFYVEDCDKLAQFLYGDNPTLYLPRKRRIFEKWNTIKRRQYFKQNYPSKIGWQLNQRVLT